VAKKAEDFDPTVDVPGPKLRPTLLVCDINAHPTDVARICLPLIALLPSGSRIIVTLKFFGTGRDRGDAIAEVVRDTTHPSSVSLSQTYWLRTELRKRCRNRAHKWRGIGVVQAAILGDTVSEIDCAWLFANTIHERILVATKT
jgi:hypothetical protein